MGVYVGHCRGESLDVLGEGVIRVGQSTIEIAHSVVGLVPKVEQVGVIDQAGPNAKSQLALKEADQTIDEGGRNGDKKPVDAVLEEQPRVLFDDRFDDPPVELSHVDGEECP